jgi:hypothetical protein
VSFLKVCPPRVRVGFRSAQKASARRRGRLVGINLDGSEHRHHLRVHVEHLAIADGGDGTQVVTLNPSRGS